MLCADAVLFDSRTNLRGGRGVCNELWLWFITVSPSDEVLCGREVRGRGGGGRIAHNGGIQWGLLHSSEVSRSRRVIMVSSPSLYVVCDAPFILCYVIQLRSRLRRVITTLQSYRVSRGDSATYPLEADVVF